MTEENNKPLSSVNLKIEILNTDKNNKQTTITSKTIKTDKTGTYTTLIQLKESLQGDTSIRLSTEDSWIKVDNKNNIIVKKIVLD